MQTVKLARQAMATRFEIVLQGENDVALRAAGEEALDEIERLDAQLSLYRAFSDIARINARAAFEPVRVEPGLFRLLQLAQRLHRESDGAFDITIAPLMRCWGFMSGSGQMPDPQQLAEARSLVGMHLVELQERDRSIRFARPGVMLDLGSIGKGYALDRAARALREAGVSRALLHGGTSTVCGLGKPLNGEAWNVAIESPETDLSRLRSLDAHGPAPSSEASALAMVPLNDCAMSVSAVHGKAFTDGSKIYGHVLDPRTGQPVAGAVLAAVALPSATETDALSTALLTLGSTGHERLAMLRPGMRTLVVSESANPAELRTEAKGIEIQARLPR